MVSFAVDNASLDDKACNDKSSSSYTDDASVGGASVSAEVAAYCEEIGNNNGKKSDDALSDYNVSLFCASCNYFNFRSLNHQLRIGAAVSQKLTPCCGQ